MAQVNIVSVVIPTQIRQYFAYRFRGQIQHFEPQLIPMFKELLRDFLKDVVEETISTTQLRSPTGKMFRHLRSGVRVFGSGSFASIRGHIRGESGAALHEYGGTLLPKRAKALALPLPAALRADGTPKRRGPNSWRPFGTFIYKSKRTRRAYIVYRSGAKLIFLYVLVGRAKFKQKLGLRRTLLKNMFRLEALWSGAFVQFLASNIDFYEYFEQGAQTRRSRFAGISRIATGLRLIRR